MTLSFPTSDKSSSAIGGILTPCVGVCTLAPNGLCIGCLRSSEEIGLWLMYSTAERKRIMLELPQRLESLFTL